MSPKYKSFINIIKQLNPKSVLDLGCGDGSFSVIIKKELVIDNVYGIDISQEATQQAIAKGITAFSLDIDSEDLPFENNFFSLVFCGEVIEHVYSPDHLLQEIHRVLKNDGYLIITTPNLASWFNRLSLLFGFQPIFSDISLNYSLGHLWKMNPFGHLRIYTLRSITRLLEAYHFKIIQTSGIGINDRIGFGLRHPILTKIANCLFRHPVWNSGIYILSGKH